MDSNKMISYGVEILVIAVLAYLFLGPPPGAVKGFVLGDMKYAKYLQPLLVGLLAVLVLWALDYALGSYSRPGATPGYYF